MDEKTPIFAPCHRGPWPALRPCHDLSQNVEAATEIVKKIDPFFYFTNDPEIGLATFSGFARQADAYDGTHPLLYVQVWRGKTLYRSFAFRGTGYVGTLNVQTPKDGLGFIHDFLESIFGEFSESCNLLPEGEDRRCLALVQGGQLTVSLPWAG